jgi:DNA-binding NarL/FixJ family response regulator
MEGNPASLDQLTKRERDILARLSGGLTTQQIARTPKKIIRRSVDATRG